jgi:hypothetical protein
MDTPGWARCEGIALRISKLTKILRPPSHAARITLIQNPGDYFHRSATTNFLEKERMWTHIAIVYSKSHSVMYRNGKRIGDLQPRELVAYGSGSQVVIGARDGRKGMLKGAVDEVMVFDRALSDEEITSIARTPNR